VCHEVLAPGPERNASPLNKAGSGARKSGIDTNRPSEHSDGPFAEGCEQLFDNPYSELLDIEIHVLISEEPRQQRGHGDSNVLSRGARPLRGIHTYWSRGSLRSNTQPGDDLPFHTSLITRASRDARSRSTVQMDVEKNNLPHRVRHRADAPRNLRRPPRPAAK